MRILVVICLLIRVNSLAVTAPAQLLRACINNDNMVVTLSWNPPEDNCGSFTKYRVYGSENNGVFQLLDEITNLAVSEYPHGLSVINTNWRYYMVTLNTCDGLDSTVSDTIDVDILYPENIQIDSVSYDLTTQHIIAGWTANIAPDTDGYQIYNFSSGDGDSIGYTLGTNYTVTTNPNNHFPIVIATLDSCSLSSLLSTPHMPAFLNSNIDTCENEITLNWSLYTGWDAIDSQVIFYSFNNLNYTPLTVVSSGTNSFTFNNFNLGDSINFYVRTFSENKSSSSNIVRIETRELVKPNYVYLDYVTVTNQDQIEIQWQAKPDQDIDHYDIKKSTDGIVFNSISQTNSFTNNYTDVSVSTNQESYFYNIVAVNKCGAAIDSGNISQSILLHLEPNLEHNDYGIWENGVNLYELERQENGSTWNSIESSTSTITPIEELTTGCYRIKATEETNSLSESNVSYSNIVCKQDSLKVFVTESINSTTSNNRFAIYGTGLDHEKSSYQVYNRWGELLVHNRTDETWLFIYNNKPIQPGVYLYVIDVHGNLGEKRTIKGTVHVLR